MTTPHTTEPRRPARALPPDYAVTTVQITETTTYDVLVAHPATADPAQNAAAGYQDFKDTERPEQTFTAVAGDDEVSVAGDDHTDHATDPATLAPDWPLISHTDTHAALLDGPGAGQPAGEQGRAWRTIVGQVHGGELDWWGTLPGVQESPELAAVIAGPAPFTMAFETDDVASAVARAAEEARWTRFGARHLVDDHPERGWCVRDLHQYSRIVVAWPDPPRQHPYLDPTDPDPTDPDPTDALVGDPTDPGEQPGWQAQAQRWADELNHAHAVAVSRGTVGTAHRPLEVTAFVLAGRDGLAVHHQPTGGGAPLRDPADQPIARFTPDEALLSGLYCAVLNGWLEHPTRPGHDQDPDQLGKTDRRSA